MKMIHEKDLKNKELELATLKGKLRTLEQTSGAGSKKIEELKKEYDEKFKSKIIPVRTYNLCIQ